MIDHYLFRLCWRRWLNAEATFRIQKPCLRLWVHQSPQSSHLRRLESPERCERQSSRLTSAKLFHFGGQLPLLSVSALLFSSCRSSSSERQQFLLRLCLCFPHCRWPLFMPLRLPSAYSYCKPRSHQGHWSYGLEWWALHRAFLPDNRGTKTQTFRYLLFPPIQQVKLFQK